VSLIVGESQCDVKTSVMCRTFVNFFPRFFFFLNYMFIVSTVQEMTGIFNDMAKTKPKINPNNQQKKQT